MNLPLSADLRQALTDPSNYPVRLIDSETKEAYIVLRAELYDRLKYLLEEDGYEITDTYRAQMESALRAGWGDPEMDAYNHYDDNVKKVYP
jgi:hypothetical protein